MSAAGERSIEELRANVLELRRSFDESFSRERAADFEELEDVLLVRIGEVPYAVLRSDVAALVTDRPVTKLLRPRRRGAGLVGIKGRLLAAFELAELLGHEPPPRSSRWMLLAGEPPVAFGVSLLEGHEKIERSLFRALDEHHTDGRFCDRVLFMGSEARRVVRLPLVLEWLGGAPRERTTK